MARTHSQVVADTNREFVNLRRTLRSMQSKGAVLSDEQQRIVDTKPSEFRKGDINAKVERELLGIRKRIRKEAKYVDPETGEVTSWERYQKERRSASARKGARTKARKKEAKANFKYIEWLDKRVSWGLRTAGSALPDVDPEEAQRIYRAEVYDAWERIKADAFSSQVSLVTMERMIKSAEAQITECFDVIVWSSDWDVVLSKMYLLRNVIISLGRGFSAFSAYESENIMDGGGFGI